MMSASIRDEFSDEDDDDDDEEDDGGDEEVPVSVVVVEVVVGVVAEDKDGDGLTILVLGEVIDGDVVVVVAVDSVDVFLPRLEPPCFLGSCRAGPSLISYGGTSAKRKISRSFSV